VNAAGGDSAALVLLLQRQRGGVMGLVRGIDGVCASDCAGDVF
jgi:hypothetical protein